MHRNLFRIFLILFVFQLFLTVFIFSPHNSYSLLRFNVTPAVAFVTRRLSMDTVCINCSSTTATTTSQPKPLYNPPRNILEDMLDPTVEHRGFRAFRLFEKRFEEDSFLREHCETCALVTSSGYLEGSKSASAIDSHQCVLRTNDSPVLGFESDVGNRTTHRIVAHSSIFPTSSVMNKSLGSNITYLLWGPDSAVKTPNGSITRWATKILQTLAPKPIIYVTFENGHSTAPFFRTIWKLENNGSVFDVNKWLTTGFHSVVTALNFCDSLTIFGLDAQKSCEDKAKNKIKYHYYQKKVNPTACYLISAFEQTRITKSHSYHTEFKIFHRWSKYRNISFRVPDS